MSEPVGDSSARPLGTNFLSLAREIRDQIYVYALVASSPIVVRPNPDTPLKNIGAWQQDVHSAVLGDEIYVCEAEYRTAVLHIQRSAPSLFRSNKVISTESTLVFYGRNTFLFCGGYTWEHTANWVESIGCSNRKSLTTLLFNVSQPYLVWQRRDGTRTGLPQFINLPRTKVFPRSPHLNLTSYPTTEGVVENIDPSIERFFRLLDLSLGSTLAIRMFLEPGCIPGKPLYPRDHYQYPYFGVDMPNLIERFCARSAIEGSRHFEVLWSGCARKTIFDAVKSTLFKRGWNILNTYETPNLMDDMGYGGFHYRDPTAIHFTMKRREIIGTLYSTAPFSNGGSMDYFDGPEPWLDDPCYETNTNEYLTLEKDEEFAVLPDGRIEAITHVGNLTDTTCSTSFLDLPQEIRKQIYGYLVLAPKQLDIYYGTALTVENRSCKRYRKIAIGSIGWKPYKEYVENILHTQFLAADLMRSNSILATELAPIYYGKNTFHFVNNFTWNDAARWLQRIGPINRGHLTDLRMEIGVLAHVWQGKDGSRTVLPNNTYPGWNQREKVYDRNPHLIVDTECVEGMVENINPALETFFEVLGSTKGGKVTINVTLDTQTVPGVQLLVDEKGHPVSRWFSMDLPNLMEKFRTIYTSRQGESREVDILWKGSEDKVAFNAGRQEVENAGWEIVNTNEEIKQSYGDKDIYPIQVYYTLRRKRIVGEIWAETFSLNSCRRGMREWNEANWLN